MGAQPPPARIALVVHPTRRIDAALEALTRWAGATGLEIVQIPTVGPAERSVAPHGVVAPGDLVVALGGDGTVLSALRAAAERAAPVLGVACGSVGALTAVTAGELDDALRRVAAGDWTARRLPALAIDVGAAPGDWALNDFVVVRRGAGQVSVDLSVDDELYLRLGGDGLVVATPLGSSAYSMAAGGPVLATDTPAVVCTPLAMHGGSGPPLVVPGSARVRLTVEPGFAGFQVEIDGQPRTLQALEYRLSLQDDHATLVVFGEPGHGVTALRNRGLIRDSPRVLAREDRCATPFA